jgi:hypothetical protein
MKITTIFAVFRYLQSALVAMPTTLALIHKIRAAFGNEKVQEAIKALGEFIDKIAPPAPPAPTAESAGKESTGGRGQQHSPVNPEKEKRRRLFRFGNRLKVAGMITDNEVQEYCAQHHIQPIDQQWA